MIVQAAIRVRVDEAMQIQVPAKGTEQIVAFEIGLALIAFDKATGSACADPLKGSINHVLTPQALNQALCSCWLRVADAVIKQIKGSEEPLHRMTDGWNDC